MAAKIILELLPTLFFTLVEAQFVFDNFKTCSYGNPRGNVTFPRSTYRISNEVLDVFINLCEPIQDVRSCDRAYVCAFEKNRNITNGGSSFIFDTKDEYGEVLKSPNNGMYCRGGSRFRTVVHVFSRFDNSSNVKAAWIKGCDIHVMVPDSNHNPECTTRIKDLLINLLPLRDLRDLIVTIPIYNNKVALSICRPATTCHDPNTVGCEIRNDNTTGLSLKNQHFEYDERTKVIKIRSHDNSNKNDKRTVSIEFQCNWGVSLGKISTSVNNVKKGKKILINVDSKYGCIKLPMNCFLNDSSYNSYGYNITELYKSDGWSVSNVTGILRLTVCGPLKFNKFNECSDKFSQICLYQSNTYLSLGSISSDLRKVEADLIMNFYHGSICPTNSSMYLTSIIVFKCSFTDNKPVLKDIIDCQYIIHWYTKFACPKRLYINNNIGTPKIFPCNASNNSTSFDVRKLMRDGNNDIVVKGDDGLEYYINLCKTLNTPECHNTHNSILCFKNTTEPNSILSYKTLGTKETFFIENNNLVLNYTGGVMCQKTPSFLYHSGRIKFECSKKNQLSFIGKTNCTHNFLYETPEVCTKQERGDPDCFYKEKITDYTFDFNSVPQKDFLVQAEDSRIYKINICKKKMYINGSESAIAPPIIKFANCGFTLNYNLMSNAYCNVQNLVLQLKCDKITNNNNYFKKGDSSNCTFNIEFWTELACTNDVTSKFCPRSKTKKSTTDLIPTTTAKQTPRNCQIYFGNTRSFNIKDLTPIIISTKDANYSIGFGGLCDDFLCKNNLVIGSILQFCPNFQVDLEETKKEAVFLGFNSSNCVNGIFTTYLTFICNKSLITSNIFKETPCSVYINFPLHEACDIQEGSNATSSYGYLIGVVIILIGCIMCIPCCLKYYRKKPYFLIGSNKSNIPVYRKNAES